MGKTFAGFLIAPLWVPVAIAAGTPYMFPHPEQRFWVYATIIIASIFAYGGTLALGVPMFLILRACGHVSFWVAAVVGFCAGVFTGGVFAILFGLSLGESLPLVLSLLADSAPQPRSFLPPGILGALVGSTLWLIARPDRQRPA